MSQQRPFILLTNDDGINSPGLLAAVSALNDLGELLVAAPSTQQTGMSRSAPRPDNARVMPESIQVDGREVTVYAVPGSPAQAVLYAVLFLARRLPDLVVSGINYGENVGGSTTASGTVGAALEAALLGVPTLAVSLETTKDYHYRHGPGVDWGTAVENVRRFATMLLTHEMPFDVDVLNVNIPGDATPDTPWRITRQSRQAYYEVFGSGAQGQPQLDHLDYRVTIHWDALEADSDVSAFAKDRVIAVTPLSVDLTSRTDLAALEKLLRTPTVGD